MTSVVSKIVLYLIHIAQVSLGCGFITTLPFKCVYQSGWYQLIGCQRKLGDSMVLKESDLAAILADFGKDGQGMLF